MSMTEWDLQSERSKELRERLRSLEEAQRATLNILEDFDEERTRLTQVQQATMNVLDDFDAERTRLTQVQQATMNLLEDFGEERHRMEQVQTASLNILDDFNEERGRLGQIQAALLNILEDIEEEHSRTERVNLKLESINKELEAFTYSVSHDLRAPLRAVSGFAQAMQEDCAETLDHQGRRYLGLISSNAKRMGQLIDDLLAFSRLGRQQMIESAVDLNILARSVYSELAPQYIDRRIEFNILPVPKTLGDKSLLHQVMINLISNALKFTRTKPEAVIEFGYLEDENAFYVKDNGVGFEMQYVNKLFGVFQRLHPVTQFEGTGVGLALVSRIITRHGGRVWAEGDVDKGATFYFSLPGTVKT